MPYTDHIVRNVMNDFACLPAAISESTDVLDKFGKSVTNLIDTALYIDCIRIPESKNTASLIKKQFKNLSDLLSWVGVFFTLNGMKVTYIDGRRNNSILTAKFANKAFLAAAQTLDFFKGLDSLNLVSLSQVTATFGRLPFASIGRNLPSLSLAKDSFILSSILFGIYDNAKLFAKSFATGNRIANKIQQWNLERNQISTQQDEIRLCQRKIAINQNRVALGQGQKYQRRLVYWEQHLQLVRTDNSRIQDEINRKIINWQTKSDNRFKAITKSLLALVTDASKAALISMSILFNKTSFKPEQQIILALKYEHIQQLLGVVANQFGLYKALFDTNEANNPKPLLGLLF